MLSPRSKYSGHTPKRRRKAEWMNEHVPAEQLRILLRYDKEYGTLWWRTSKEIDELFGKVPNLYRNRVAGKEAMANVNTQGAYTGGVEGYMVLRHHVIWCYHKGYWPDFDLDYIDGNKHNHRIENLTPKLRKEAPLEYPGGPSRRWAPTEEEVKRIFELSPDGKDILWKVDFVENRETRVLYKVKKGHPAFPVIPRFSDDNDKDYHKIPEIYIPRIELFGHRLFKHAVARVLHGIPAGKRIQFWNHNAEDISLENLVIEDDDPIDY